MEVAVFHVKLPPRFFMKKFVVIVMLIALAGGGWALYSRQPRKEADQTPRNRIARAERRDIDFSIEVSGDVTPAFQLEVKPEVGGKIKALHVEPGQEIKEGDLLVEIDDRDLLTERDSALTEIEGAKLTVDRTRRNFERGKELSDAKLISREVYENLTSEYEIAQNGLAKSERRLQLVEDKLRKTKVIAPAAGTALTVPVIAGQVVIAAASVNSGTTLMTVADLSKLLVEVHINQVDVARLELNQRVHLRAESLRDVEMEAQIFRIAPIASVKNNIKGFQVQALIENPNPRLRPGMTVNMKVPIAKAEDAVAIPVSAVFRGDGNAKVVYVRSGDGAEKREVKVGVTNIDFAQIVKGVAVGEEILLVEPDRPATATAASKKS